MRRHRAKRIASLGVGLAAAACLWHYLAPVGVGGTTSYVVTDGVSMEPRFHAGDLALVRSQPSYRVGEIVAYHSRQLGTVVLHRIIGREGSRYVFKGDNNNFVDFERPTAAQLVGALWLHVPGLGSRLQSLHTPLVVGGLVALGTALLAGVTLTRRRLRRRARRRSVEIRSRPRAPGASAAGGIDPLVGVVAAGVLAAAPFVALAVIAFARAATAQLPVRSPYRQTATLSYSASAPRGAAYPTGEVRTGDPLFTRVIDRVALRMESDFQAREAHSLDGRASMHVLLQATNGWHATLPLQGARSFHGDRAVVRATLDLRALLSLVGRVQSTTQVPGSYTLTVVGDVTDRGEVGGLPLHSTFSPQFYFSLGTLEVQPATKGTAAADGLVQSNSGVARGLGERPTTLSLAALAVSVADARRIALGGIALVACLVVLALLATGLRSEDEAARIRKRYGRLIVAASHVGHAPDVAVVDVSEIEALVRIAEHYDRSILHEERAGAFWVIDESGRYRYVTQDESDRQADRGRVNLEALGFEVEGEVSAYAATREHRVGRRPG